jgi:hypothetical protein
LDTQRQRRWLDLDDSQDRPQSIGLAKRSLCRATGDASAGSKTAENRWLVARLRQGRHFSAMARTSCWLGEVS